MTSAVITILQKKILNINNNENKYTLCVLTLLIKFHYELNPNSTIVTYAT